jgi:hypothetical protein
MHIAETQISHFVRMTEFIYDLPTKEIRAKSTESVLCERLILQAFSRGKPAELRLRIPETLLVL